MQIDFLKRKRIVKWLKSTTALLSILAVTLHSTAIFATDLKNSEEENLRQQEEIIQAARNLEKNFEDPSRKEVELDHFQLLSQTYNNSEKEDILAKIELIQKADPDGENVEDFIDEDLPLKRHYSNNLQIQIVDEEGKEIKRISQKQFSESYSPRFSEDLSLEGFRTFRIVDAKGNLLHTFHRDIDSVGFYGPFLVYIEKNSYNEGRGITPLRFINLEYFKASIGNANLPVFTLPIKTGPLTELKIINGKLHINDTKITGDAIKVLSDLYQVYFNISVSLVDPKTQIRAEGMLKELAYFFGKTLEMQDQKVKDQLNFALQNEAGLQSIVTEMEKKTQVNSQVSKLELEKKKDLINAIKTGDREKIIKLAETESAFKNNILQTNRSMQASRLFLSRIYMTMAKMAEPTPLGSTKIIKSMIMFVEGVLKKDKDLRDYAKASLLKHPYFKYVKFGSYAVAAAAIGSELPEPYAFHLYQLIDLSSMLFEQAHGYLESINFGLNYGDLYVKASKVAFSGVLHVADYFREEVVAKFFVGLTSTITIPFIVFGVPHFLVNGIKASKDMSQNWRQVRLAGNSRLQTFKKTFIDYIQRSKTSYDDLMSLSEQEISRIDNSKLTDDEVAELRDLLKTKNSEGGRLKLANIKESLRKLRSNTGEFFKNVSLKIGHDTIVIGKGAQALNAVGDFIAGNFLKKTVAEEKRIDTFGKAFSQFCLSYPSLTNTFKTLATTWNYIFITRSFALKPSTWYMALVYPQFFGTAIRSTPGAIHNPTSWNGGKVSTVSTLVNALSSRSLAAQEKLAMKEWEKAVLPIERIVHEEAMNKALEALVRKIDDPKKLQELFDSTQLPGTRETRSSLMEAGRPTGGIAGLTDSKLKKLSGEDLSFFRAFFTKTYDDTMSALVQKVTIDSLPPESKDEIERISKMSDFELKKYSSRETIGMNVLAEVLADPKKGEYWRTEVKNTMNKAIAQNNINGFANDVSKKLGFFFERKKINYHHNLLKIVDPKGPQVGRFATAERMLAKPTAVARAVRAEVAALLIDKPLSLLTLLTLYAGVTEGIMKPFYPEAMFGAESFFYMSRYLILNGFITGTIISIMADTWMKVQTDSRIQDDGGFDKVPTQEWRKKGFWRYFFKSMFNPKNKWSTNQIFYTKLVWANIPAVFVMSLATNMLTLGRFDLTAFLTMYIFVFTTPFMGINLKIEQAFELSSSWVRAQIPKKYRAHPEAQEYIQNEIQKKKLMFNFVNHIYQTLSGTINNLFENMDTKEYGPRSFARLIFFGYTPTELAVLGIRKVGDTLGFIPGIEPLTHFCEHILTNNDTSLIKIKPE